MKLSFWFCVAPRTHFSSRLTSHSEVNTGFTCSARSSGILGFWLGGSLPSAIARLYEHHESRPSGQRWCRVAVGRNGVVEHRPTRLPHSFNIAYMIPDGHPIEDLEGVYNCNCKATPTAPVEPNLFGSGSIGRGSSSRTPPTPSGSAKGSPPRGSPPPFPYPS